MVCAALLWDRLITPERAAMPFYAEFSDVKTPVAVTSAEAPNASPQLESMRVLQQKGALNLSEFDQECARIMHHRISQSGSIASFRDYCTGSAGPAQHH